MPNASRLHCGRTAASLAIALALALPARAGAQDTASRSPLRPRSTAEDLQMFSQVLNQIRVNHPDSLNMHELFMAAIDIGIAGAKGSTVTLGLERRRIDGSLVRLDRVVKRERVEDATAVPAAFMLDQQTGYVRITTFVSDKVADDLHDALGRLEGQGMRRVLIDLRDNGGGRVDQAARIAGEFLPKGAIVYTAEGRKSEVPDTSRVSRSFWRSEKRHPIWLDG